MLTILPIPAFNDNYIWLIINPNNHCCAIVDPGDANPVIAQLQALDLKPVAILITHHHADHIGGVNQLINQYNVPVYGLNIDKFPGKNNDLEGKSEIIIKELPLTFEILSIPGHTLDHIAYLSHSALFCGDTLFSAGCGRVFEGTDEQMLNSLGKIASLSENTSIYCAHEYTIDNLRFAEAIEPENLDIQQHIKKVTDLRQNEQISLPSTLELEKKINPFLRCHTTSVKNAAEMKAGKALTTTLEVFSVIRAWKNNF